MKEAGVRFGYMLLCSRVPASLSVSQEDVVRAIKDTIDWRRRRIQDPNWNPIGGEYDSQIIHSLLKFLHESQPRN